MHIHDQRGDLQTASAQWLRDIRWQLFGCFQFPSARIRYETAHSKFHSMLNTIAHNLQTRVGAVYAMERRSKSGATVLPHFHAALTALKPLEPKLVASMWVNGLGRRDTEDSDLAVVELYDPNQAGVEYICKQIADNDCEPGLRDIDFFSPSMPKPHMGARAARRWQEQLTQAHSEDTQQV